MLTPPTCVYQVAKHYNATAVHPGYGFLSENEEFCDAIESAGIAWLGPTAKTMQDFALKHVARELAKAAGVRAQTATRQLSSAVHDCLKQRAAALSAVCAKRNQVCSGHLCTVCNAS